MDINVLKIEGYSVEHQGEPDFGPISSDKTPVQGLKVSLPCHSQSKLGPKYAASQENIVSDETKAESHYSGSITNSKLQSASTKDALEASSRSGRSYKCDNCSKDFSRKTALVAHIKSLHGSSKPFPCHLCDKSWASQSHLKQHLDTHTSNDHGVERTKPGKQQQQKPQLKQELSNSCLPDPDLRCKVCFKTFKSQKRLTAHSRLVHTTGSEKKFKCDICLKSFGVKKNFHLHLYFVHGQKIENLKVFNCQSCSCQFSCKSHLKNHISEKHIDIGDKTFECHVCSKAFINEHSLTKHLRIHDRPKKYICDICSLGFKFRVTLTNHLGIVHKTFFYCNKCVRSFKNKSEFEQHLEKESKTGKLTCDICPDSESFDSQCFLNTHMESHLNELKTSKNGRDDPEDMEELALAKGENSKATEFKCESCPKTFDREAYLSAHRKSSHPSLRNQTRKKEHSQKLPCSICGKSFYYGLQFKLHMAADHGLEDVSMSASDTASVMEGASSGEFISWMDYRHNCDKCDKSFKKHEYLRLHVRKVHSEVAGVAKNSNVF